MQHPTYYQFGYQVSDKYTQDYHGHMEHNSGELTHGKTGGRINEWREGARRGGPKMTSASVRLEKFLLSFLCLHIHSSSNITE